MRKRPARRLPEDVAVLHGPTADGEGARILRLRKGELFAGEVRPAREGQPVGNHELVRLKPLASDSPVCEVEVLHAPTSAERSSEHGSHGPARVATDRYRRNWGQVFSPRRPSAAGNANRRDLSLN